MTMLGLTEGSESTQSSGISLTKGNLMDQHSFHGDQLLLQPQDFCGLKKEITNTETTVDVEHTMSTRIQIIQI